MLFKFLKTKLKTDATHFIVLPLYFDGEDITFFSQIQQK